MSEMIKKEESKKKKRINDNQAECVDKLEITDQNINLNKDDERPGIGWEITGSGSNGGGGN